MIKIKIDFKSMFQRGIKTINDDFGIYLITGYQGSGKTWYSIYLMEKEKDKKIYTNIKSYTSPRNDVHYFDRIEDITENVENNCIFLIDEVSKRYTKETKQDLKFYSWLQQSRKHKRYVYLITQEYIQVPMWLRGIANKVYTTSKVPLMPIFKTLNLNTLPLFNVASATSFFFLPNNDAPIGDSLEILFSAKSTSVEPTIVYSTFSSNSISRT